MMVALVLAISFSGLPTQLEAKARTALADVAKARTALSLGNSKSGQSWLTKAEGLLGSVLGQLPGGNLLKKTDPARDRTRQGETGAVAQAESEAARLDPSLAGKLGAAKEKASPGDTTGASNAPESTNAVPPKSGLGEIGDLYRKVVTARSLLKAGENSKAKTLLDQIPSP